MAPTTSIGPCCSLCRWTGRKGGASGKPRGVTAMAAARARRRGAGLGAEPCDDDGRGDANHPAQAGAAAGAFVTDDDDVPLFDAARAHRLEGVFFTFEDAGGAAVQRAFVTAELHDGAVGGERAAQDAQTALVVERLREGTNDFLSCGFARLRGMLRPGLAVGGARVAVEELRLEE